MAELPINLSGKPGLMTLFSGDTDRLTPDPNLRIADGTNSYVSGLFNPYLREGYLAPTTTTSVTLTHGSTPTSEFRAVEYDHTSGEVILIDDTSKIYKLSSLTDTSTELVETLGDTNDYGTFEYDELYDAQVYKVNGTRKLFVVGKSLPYGGSLIEYGTTTGDSSLVTTFAINPDGATQPTVVDAFRQFTASPGTSDSLSVTVPSGTNQVLYVICFWSNAYNAAYIYTYGDSTTMTDIAERQTAPGFMAAYYVAPSTGTYNVEIAGPAGGFTNLTMLAFITDNTDQTYPVSFNSEYTTEQSLSAIMDYINENQLNVVAMYSNGTTTLSTDYTKEAGASQAFGEDELAQDDTVPVSGLQIGYLPLPISTTGVSYQTWLSSRATGSFYQELTSDYAFMRNADNGFSYVFAGNAVHKIDGNTTGGVEGTITKNVLLFPDTFRITDAIDYRSSLYIAVHQYPATVLTTSLNNYNGVCGVYIWNRVSTQLSQADFIELTGVREIKKIYGSPDGVVKLIVINSDGLTELRQFGYNDSGGVVFPAVKRFGIGAYPQTPEGFTVGGNKSFWLANDGYLYCEQGNAITKLHEIDAPGATTSTVGNNILSGIIFYGSGSETASSGYRSNKQGILLSYTESSTIYTEKIYPFDLTTGSNGSQTPHQGDVYTGVMYLPTHSIIRNIRIYNAPIAGSGTTAIATVKIYFNQSSTVGMTKTITKDEAARGYVDLRINKPYAHAVQLEFEWSTSITLDGDIYLPSAGIITYDESSMKSPDSE